LPADGFQSTAKKFVSIVGTDCDGNTFHSFTMPGRQLRVSRAHIIDDYPCIVDRLVWADVDDMQLSEDLHAIFGHIVMQTLCGMV
jgi:hypothetical protein